MRAMPNEKQSLTIYNRIRKMNKIIIQNPRIINEGRSFIGSVLVEGISGDYYNVMGLPVCRLARMLVRFGVDPLALAAEKERTT